LNSNKIPIGALGVSPPRSVNQRDIYAATTSNVTWVRFSLVGNSCVNGREVERGVSKLQDPLLLEREGALLCFPQAPSSHARPSLFFLDKDTSSLYFEYKRDHVFNMGSHDVKSPFDGLRFGFIQTV